jgi:uncharacterized membrane protein YkvA (DUF1232 family)
MLNQLKTLAKQLKQQLTTVYYISKHPNLPFYIKILAVCTLFYALNPIDLIPDFIPVLGLLDDIIIVPLVIWLILKITPKAIVDQSRELANTNPLKLPKNIITGIIFVTFWLVLLFIIIFKVFYKI